MHKFLRNRNTGVVLPRTDLLDKHPHLVPCDGAGRPIHSMDNAPQTPYLMNPVTKTIDPWSPALANTPGMIGVNTPEEGREILQALGAIGEQRAEAAEPFGTLGATHAVGDLEERGQPAGLQPPEPPPAATGARDAETEDAGEQPESQTEDPADPFEGIDLAAMDKEGLKQFALDQFDEKMDGRLAEEALRQQVAVMMNARRNELRGAA